MQISVLREFLLLAEQLSFSRVSKNLYVSQSALSKHVDALENEVGAKLFVRDKHSVRLTKIGRLFNNDIKVVMRAYDDALENLNNAKRGLEEIIKVGHLHGATHLFFPAAATEFESAYPHTKLQFDAGEAGSLFSLLTNNTYDMIITMRVPNEDYGNFKYIDLYQDRLCVAVSRHHRLARQQDVCLTDLINERILVARRDTMQVIDLLARLDIKEQWFWDCAEERVNDFHTPLTYLSSNTGVVLTCQHLKTFYSDEVVFLPLREIQTGYHISAVWKIAHDTDGVRAFARILEQAAQPYLDLLAY